MHKKEIVISGIRPTGQIHLGNYFGAIQNFVKMQSDYNCFFMVADLHSLTTHPDTKSLTDNVYQAIASYLAVGINPEISTIFVQSTIPQITELYYYLNTMAYVGELEKTTTFKEKARQNKDNINAALLTYPVLMGADILVHRANYVPVGKDQEQHLEMTRTYANRFNHRYGYVFPEPQAFNFGNDLIKVPSLDGNGKMSKSENENATIYLSDDDETIRKKIKKAKTDSGPTQPNEPMPDYIEGLFYLMNLVSTPETTASFKNDFNTATIRYGDFKNQLANDVIAFVQPIRSKTEALFNNKKYLHEVIELGKAKAEASAAATLSLVREHMNLVY